MSTCFANRPATLKEFLQLRQPVAQGKNGRLGAVGDFQFGENCADAVLYLRI